MQYAMLLIMVILLAGCASQGGSVLEFTPTDEPTAISTDSELVPTPTPTGTLPIPPLVQVERHGGLCIAGECRFAITIMQDGSIYFDQRAEQEEIGEGGSLSADELAELRALIAETDFEAIRATPFTDICPTAYDGQETIYTIYQEDGSTERLASCEVVIDPAHPLIAWLEALIASVSAQTTQETAPMLVQIDWVAMMGTNTLTIDQAGHYRKDNAEGDLSAEELAELRALIEGTDFKTIPPRTDTCPAAIDAEPYITYRFSTPQGEFVLENCTHDLNYAAPLITWLDAFLARIDASN